MKSRWRQVGMGVSHHDMRSQDGDPGVKPDRGLHTKEY